MTTSRPPTNPDEARLRDVGLGFPEATEEFPWSHRALKVKGKVFVFMGTGKEGGADHEDFFISCKLPHSSAFALTLPGVVPTGYGLGKSGWVSARFRPGKAPVPMLAEWLRESYCAIAPKKLAALVGEAAAIAPKTASGKAKKAAATKATAKKAAKKAKKAAAKKATAKKATAKKATKAAAKKATKATAKKATKAAAKTAKKRTR